jgi:hypothetical protein
MVVCRLSIYTLYLLFVGTVQKKKLLLFETHMYALSLLSTLFEMYVCYYTS